MHHPTLRLISFPARRDTTTPLIIGSDIQGRTDHVCHVTTMSQIHRHHVTTTSPSRHRRVTATSLPHHGHVTLTPRPCHCHVTAAYHMVTLQ